MTFIFKFLHLASQTHSNQTTPFSCLPSAPLSILRVDGARMEKKHHSSFHHLPSQILLNEDNWPSSLTSMDPLSTQSGFQIKLIL